MLLVKLPPGAKNEDYGVLLNFLTRAKREAKGVFQTYLERSENLKELSKL